MLSDKEIIYALHTHNVRTDSIPKYLENYQKTVQLIEAKKEEISCDLVASWTVQVGDMDQVLHLWRYTGGFEAIDQAKVRATSEVDNRDQSQLAVISSTHTWMMMILFH